MGTVTGAVFLVFPVCLGAGALAADGAGTRIRADGVGPITATTPPARLGRMFPGLTLQRRRDDGEDHSFDEITLSRGATPVLRVIVDRFLDEHRPFRVDVLDPSFATAGGAGVGSPVARVAIELPDLACEHHTYADNAEHWGEALFCASPHLPRVSFQLDPAGFRGPQGTVALADLARRTIVRISWKP